METTTFTIPTIFLALIVFVSGAILIGYKIYKDKKNENFVNIEQYFPNIISVIQKVVTILTVNMDSFNTRDEYINCIVGTTIKYLKEDAVKFNIPKDLVNMISTEYLTTVITNLINEKYFTCFDILSTETISEYPVLFNDDFVKCKCGKDGCNCEEGKCDCE